MNVPPQQYQRVHIEDLRGLLQSLFAAAGAPDEDGRLITELLIDTDLRGVFSHGTVCVAKYARAMRAGQINPRPQVRVVDDQAATAVVDGDGGLGHLAAHRATELVVDKVGTVGLAAVVARNHAHFGGAGKYTRMIARKGCFGFCVSGHTLDPRPGRKGGWNFLGNPPMAFAFPHGKEAPLHLDMGTSWFEPEHFPEVYDRVPAAFFKSLGLIGVSTFLGGIMADMMQPRFQRESRTYAQAGLGTFVLAVDIQRFVSLEEFCEEADRTMRRLHELPALPGCERFELPGGPEWRREQDYAERGIPLGEEHRRTLEEIAAELDIPVPW